MKQVTDPFEFQALCRSRGAATLGLVPTMGALHAGHISLVRAARQHTARVAVTIFVNPTQFGPHEDLDRYPRTLERDLALLSGENVDWAFTPEPGAIYLPGDATRVEVAGLNERLDGASRPGHFRGVATVVLKLLQLSQPDRAYFGQKDAAQVAVLRRMIRDLFLPVEMIVCPIVRESDGVAMSSRNALLRPDERRAARAISQALRHMGTLYCAGERSSASLTAAGRSAIAAECGLRLDFLAAVDGDSLLPVSTVTPGTLFAAAAFAGATRLIDNARVAPDGTWSME